MEVDNALAAGIRAAASGGTGRADGSCKWLLTDRYIMANVMKSVMWEYAGYDVRYIAERCIEGEVEAESVAVMPNETNAPGCRIAGGSTTDASVNEGTVYYDVRFKAVVPGRGGGAVPVELIVNIEAQGAFRPGYPLVRRGLYYAARLISAQKGVEFTGSRYGEIRKVYSVWLCLNPPRGWRNTVTVYRVREENVVGEAHEEEANYDLLTVALVCLGERGAEHGAEGAVGLLNVLFSRELSGAERCRILGEEYGVPVTERLEEEVENMCTYSEVFYSRGEQSGWDRGWDKGRSEGISIGRNEGISIGRNEGISIGRNEGISIGRNEGISIGRSKANADVLQKMVRKLDMTPEAAMDTLEIPEAERPRYRAMFQR